MRGFCATFATKSGKELRDQVAQGLTSPALRALLGEDAERNFDHPSQTPARRGRRAQFTTTPPDLPFRRGGVL